MFTIYSFLLTVGFILMSPVFLLKREKYAAGFWQRMGHLPRFEPDGRPVVWLHCVSVGETNAARPLVEEIKIRHPDTRLIVSTTTVTGQTLAREIFKDRAETVFYFPFDWKFSVRRALGNFRPDLILLVETEIWFNFLREAARRGAKTVIVNGRLSEKSFRNFSRIKKFLRRVLGDVELALMQSAADADRLGALGMPAGKIKITGNIKFDQDVSARENDLTRALETRFSISADAPLVVAASTHAPEEKWLLQAWRQVLLAEPRARLLFAPRHPTRFDEVAALIEAGGFKFARRSDVPSPRDRQAEIILLDSIGELRAVYPLAEIVFVGGSLIPHGGQSILEPALAGRAIVTGFYTTNFAAAVKEFTSKEALGQLPATDENSAAGELARVFAGLLADGQKRAGLGRRALDVMRENRGATAATLDNLARLFPAAPARVRKIARE